MLNLFWISVSILAYHLIGYGLLLKLINIFVQRNKELDISNIDLPTITVLCPAYNEEDVIEEKIESFLNLDYPKEKIRMMIISDDSTDNTNVIVNKYSEKGYIELVVQKPRKGKQCGHNLVEPTIDSDYVLSTDANSIFQPDAVIQLLKVMLHDDQIGMVSGELKLNSPDGQDSGEGLYWKYESFLKRSESNLYSIIGSNGSVFLIKRELFTQVDAASVDDFERTLITLNKGFKAKYAPNAIVFEGVSIHAKEEVERKIRIIAQEWFAIRRQKKVFANPVSAFMLISHKLIRWTFPLYSVGILISSTAMYRSNLFLLFSIIQLLGYSIGAFTINRKASFKSNKIFKLAAYITAMNYSAVMAFIQFVKGKQFATWNTIREDN